MSLSSFDFEPAEVVQQAGKFAIQQRLLAVERILLVGGLGDPAGDFHPGGVGLIDGVSQGVGLLFDLFGSGVAFAELRGEPGDSIIDFGDLRGDGLEFRAAGKQPHRGSQRAGAQRPVRLEHLAGVGDIAVSARADAMQIGGDVEIVDDDRLSEQMFGNRVVIRLDANQIGGDADAMRMGIPVIPGITG